MLFTYAVHSFIDMSKFTILLLCQIFKMSLIIQTSKLHWYVKIQGFITCQMSQFQWRHFNVCITLILISLSNYRMCYIVYIFTFENVESILIWELSNLNYDMFASIYFIFDCSSHIYLILSQFYIPESCKHCFILKYVIFHILYMYIFICQREIYIHYLFRFLIFKYPIHTYLSLL